MKKIFLFAAVLAMGVTGCMKDNTGTGEGGTAVNGPAGNLSVAFTMPKVATQTRVDQPASVGEVEVSTVTVFLFDKNGVALATPTDGIAKLTVASDFTGTVDAITGKTTYTLNSDKLIKTLSGDALIYVAANVPASLNNAYATTTALGAAFESVANYSKTAEFTMISDEKPVNLKPSTADAPVVTKASFTLGRVVAKVVATSTAASYTATWQMGTAADTSDDVKLTYTILEYNVYNEAIDSYFIKGVNTKSTLNTFDASYLKGTSAPANGYKPVTKSVNYTATNDAAQLALLTNQFYIGENNTSAANLKVNTTYAFVSTTVAVDKTAVWDVTTKDVKWDATKPFTPATDAVLYVIPHGTKTYLVAGTKSDNTMAETIAKALGKQPVADDPLTLENETAAGIPLSYFPYTDGYVHYPVFLNPDETPVANNYIIGRNEFIHLKITNIKTLDGKFTGYPGDPDEPKKPVDPEDETDPINPDPWTPTETVDPEPSQLEVSFDIAPWLYVENEVELQR